MTSHHQQQQNHQSLTRSQWEQAKLIFDQRDQAKIEQFLEAYRHCLDVDGTVFLDHACSTDNLVLARALLAREGVRVEPKSSCLIFHTFIFKAATQASLELLQLLVRAGADVNAPVHGFTALEIIINNELHYGTRPLKKLLQVGADPSLAVSWTDYYGRRYQGSALLMAIATGRSASAQVLIQHPATNVHDCDSDGRTALFLALQNETNYYCSPDHHSNKGSSKSLLDYFASSRGLPAPAAAWDCMPHVFRLLLSRGASPFVARVGEETIFERVCREGRVPAIFDILRNHPCRCITTVR